MRKMVSAFAFLLTLVLLVSPAGASSATADARVFDNAGLFSDAESQSIRAGVDALQQQTHLDFAVLTTDDFLGFDEPARKAFADGFYDAMGFGLDGVHSGLLVYIDMDARMLYLSTCGNAMELYPDARIEAALDAITPMATAGQYADAVLWLLADLQSEYQRYWAAALPQADQPAQP